MKRRTHIKGKKLRRQPGVKNYEGTDEFAKKVRAGKAREKRARHARRKQRGK